MNPPQQRMTVGLMLPTAANIDDHLLDPRRTVAAAKMAEEGGFDGVYVGDHLLHPHPMVESVVTMSLLAGVTERVSLGFCVMLVGLREPKFLAKQLGTLAAYAPGRLRVGVGVGGEYPGEFAAMGLPLPERGRRMEQVLTEVQQLLQEGLLAAVPDGTQVQLAPIAPDVPFLLAGWKDVSLRRAARLGNGWIGYLLRVDSFGRRREKLLAYRQEYGLADQPFVTGMLLPVHVAGEGGDAHAEASAAWGKLTNASSPLPEGLFVAGSSSSVVDQLGKYWEAGCTEVMLAPADQGHGYLTQVERLCDQVLPALRAFA